jgi:hypothetical protein
MSREIPVYSVKASEFSYEYFETIKKSMVTQILDASEYILDSAIDMAVVCTIDILSESGDSLMLFDCKVTYSDIVNELHKLMPWIIENEEYELAQRVKFIEERLSTDK